MYQIAIYDNKSERVAEATIDTTKDGINAILDIIFESNYTAIVRKSNESE